ncbi:hypothetical protein Trydic_g17012 [Trypoxylus dichotomus]
MADIKTAIRKHGGIKHSFTVIKRHINALEGKTEYDHNQILELEERIAKCDLLYGEFLQVQTVIEQLCDDDSLEEQHTQCTASTCKICHKSNEDIKTEQIANVTSIVLADCGIMDSKHAMLSTALVKVKGHCGNFQIGRALLDCRSEATFITKEFCNSLKLKTVNINLNVTGLCIRFHRVPTILNLSHHSFHFLIGLKVTSVPDPDVTTQPVKLGLHHHNSCNDLRKSFGSVGP